MNSKEAFKRILEDVKNYYSNEYIQLVEQDLDRLENLEKENKELRKSIKSWDETAGNLLKENIKLKNVIDILVDELDIKLVTSIFADELGDYYLEFKIDTNKRILRKITKEKYELLKEVFENER